MEYFNQPFKLKKTGSESSVTLHLQLYFTKKVTGKSRVSCNPDSISILSMTEEVGDDDGSRSKKMSIISGASVENMPFGDNCETNSDNTSLGENDENPLRYANPVTLDENGNFLSSLKTCNKVTAGPLFLQRAHLQLHLQVDPSPNFC